MALPKKLARPCVDISFAEITRTNVIRPSRRGIAATTFQRQSHSTSLGSASKPLTQEQRTFLDSAVSQLKMQLVISTDSLIASSQSCRRARRHTHIHCSKPPHRPRLSALKTTHGTHVQSRSRPFQDIQRNARQTSDPAYCHVSRLGRGSDRSRLGNGHVGQRGGNGMY